MGDNLKQVTMGGVARIPGRSAPQTRAKRRLSLDQRRNLWGVIFVLPAVLYIASVMVGPLFFNFWLSLNKWNPLSDLNTAKWVAFENYKFLLTIDTQFIPALKTSFVYAFARVIGNVVIGLGLALLMSSRRVKGLKMWRIAIFLPMATSPVIMARIWALMFERNFGIINTLTGLFGLQPVGWLQQPDYALSAIILIAIYQSVGYYAILFLAAVQGIPEDLLDAAYVDGANARQALWHIKLPLLRPVIAFVVVISTIAGLQVFDLVYATTGGGPANATNTIVLLMYRNVFVNGRAGMGAAMAFILFAIIIVLAVIQLRLLREQD